MGSINRHKSFFFIILSFSYLIVVGIGQICMTPAGFEPAIPASERPQTHALDRAATGIVWHDYYSLQNRARKLKISFVLGAQLFLGRHKIQDRQWRR